MNLLVLSPWFPYPPDNGSRQRIYHLIRELSKSHTIRLIAGVQEDSPSDIPEPLAALCASVERVPWIWHRGETGGTASAIRALLSPVPRSVLETANPALEAAIQSALAQKTDALLVCELGMDAYLPATLPPGMPVVMEGAEVSGMENAYRSATGTPSRLRNGLTYAKGVRYWRHRLRRYSAVTGASVTEAEALRRVVGRGEPPVVVVPNGVDVGVYSACESSHVVPGRLIYNGALTYGPNRDAVAYFVRDILPRVVERVPEAHLVVTGRYTPESTVGILSNPRVQFTGYLPTLQPALAEAAVCVVPLQRGGGTRLKILEAWAAGLPVVATPIGASGLEGATSGEHLMIAADATAFADAVIRVLTTPALADSIARNARRLAEAQYGWTAITRRLVALLEPNGNEPVR